jgi:ADP-ribose pyrophosphatase YjhB (NUDIX family)
MKLQIHDYQISILRTLLFKPGARFRDLNKQDIPNDHFTFHLKRLLQEGLIIKKDNRYQLTDNGKEFANRMDTDNLKLEKQAKLAIALHPVRTRNGITEYLVHKRLKEPFYGWHGSISGKIRWGESPLDCAKRELAEETGLSGKCILKGIIHYHHIHQDGRFLEDKYFWVFQVKNTTGKLKEKVEEGENIWMTESTYRKLDNVFATFEELTDVINNKKLVYLDRIKIVNNY